MWIRATTTLSEAAIGRNNNYNLIRMLAAVAVLFSHSFVLATGSRNAEPLRLSLGITWGDMAVDAFFITSGLLVTASLLSRRRVIDFVWARALRIFPALWVMLLLTTLVLGAYFTAESSLDYLRAQRTWHYLVKNALLFRGIQDDLPGLFSSNPAPYAVNGSLWTLPIELSMYASLLVVWILAQLAGIYRLTAFKTATLGITLAAGGIYLFDGFYFQYENNWPRLYFMFFSGAVLYVFRDHIRLSREAFWLLSLALGLSALERTLFFFVFNATSAYLLIYIAYGFEGHLRTYNKVGDYSYGTYIYAFPIQQAVAAAIPGISVFALLIISGSLTLTLAVASWHALESRALRLKGFCAEATRRWLRLSSTAS